jgi:D-threonine aldolase
LSVKYFRVLGMSSEWPALRYRVEFIDVGGYLFPSIDLTWQEHRMDSPTHAEWYRIDNIDEIDSPSLVVYPERVRANVRKAVSMVGVAARLRPHVKTHKSFDAARLQLAEGISRFKCATIAEAEMLAIAGAPDVLLAYQPVGPKIRRLLALTRKYRGTTFSCLIDDAAAAASIAQAFAAEPEPLGVFLDLNVGMNRTGVRPGPEALHLTLSASSMKGIRPVGLHAYDGHIDDREMMVRTQRCDESFASVLALRDEVHRRGIRPMVIVAGGSPSFPVHARRPEVECSPGTFIYWDKSYLDGLPEQDFHPAALVVARIVSRPSADVACLDLGHKSIAAEKEIGRRVFFLNAPTAVLLAQSEEHLLLRLDDAGRHPVGEVFYGLPFHICPTCALYERAITVTNNRADGEWTMAARDRRLSE